MGAFTAFLWGFCCGVATLVGGATYAYIALNSSKGPKELEDDDVARDDGAVKKTTTEILMSLGIKPEEIERLKALDQKGTAAAPGAGKEGPDHHDQVPQPQDGSNEEERDLEADFQESSKASKSRIKELKVLTQLMTTLATQTGSHAKALEKASHTAEAQAQTIRKEGGQRSQSSEKWWAGLASVVLQMSDEHRRLSDAITLLVVDRLQQLHERHAKEDKHLNAEGARILKDLNESATTYATEEKERDRIQGKYEAYVTKLTNVGKSMAEVKDSAEYKKLVKRLQEAEEKVQEANEGMSEANRAFTDKMPRIVREFSHLDESGESHERQLVISFGELLRESEENTGKAAFKFVSAMQQHGKGDHEVILEQAIKSSGHVMADLEQPFQVPMDTDAIVQLAATSPSKIPTLPTQLVAGIGRESMVWFNAFSGRMYRDATSSILFREWFSGILFRLMNKGSKPGYIDEFQVHNLRFGSMPPMLKNAKWVPTSALEGADLHYDIAMVADMVYPGGFGFKVATKLWLNWPKPGTAHLPIAVDIHLEELSGPVRIGVRKQQAYMSFLSEPHTRFTVKTTMGETNQISNVPKLSSIIITKMKQAIRSKLVHPKAKTFKLPWPRNWWPETAEQELLRRQQPGYVPPPAHTMTPESPMSPGDAKPQPQGGVEIPTSISISARPPPIDSPAHDHGAAAHGVISPLSDSSLHIDDAISVVSEGSEASGPPTEGKRGAMQSSSAAHASFHMHSGTTTTASATGGGHVTSKKSMTSVFSSFYQNVKTKMATTTTTAGLHDKAAQKQQQQAQLRGPIGSAAAILQHQPHTTAAVQQGGKKPGQDDDSDNEAPPRGPKEEEEEEEEDDEDAEVRYGADFKDKLMAASLDLEREEIDEQPLPPQQDQPQEQQSPALAPAPEDVATKFVLPLAPPAEEAAALASQPLSGSNLSGTMHSTAAAWEGAWDDEANALEGQDSLGREDGAARRSSEGTEKDDDERGNGELAVSSQHHRRQSATTHHVVIETETRKIEIELREDSLDLAKDRDMPSTAPERYKRARSSVTDRRTVVREFLEVGNAHTLTRRHSFAGLTEHQARYIEIHLNSKDEDDEDDDGVAPGLKRVISKDDCHEYAEQKSHWWTQQLQGVVAKGHHAAKRLASKAKAEIVAGAVGLGGGGGSESDSDDEHSSPRRQAMKETQAKMKSLARKVFSTVQQKSTALPKINADFLGFSPSVSGGGGERVMDHEAYPYSPLSTLGKAEREGGAAVVQTAEEALPQRHEFTGWVKEEVFGGVSVGARKRWARIRGRHLLLFENEKETAIKSVFLLRDSICRPVKDSKQHAFELMAARVSNGTSLAPKRIILHAASEDELMAWIFHIQTAATSHVEEEQVLHHHQQQEDDAAGSLTVPSSSPDGTAS